MSEPLPLNGAALRTLATMKMPFGRYQGHTILALPEPYLLWFQKQGFPHGQLGQLMALSLEIKVNGLEGFVAEALARDRLER